MKKGCARALRGVAVWALLSGMAGAAGDEAATSRAGSGQVACAVGFRGTVLWTTDGGQTWTKKNTGVTVNLQDVDLLDEKTAVIVGENGTVVRTSDGGRTWRSQKLLGGSLEGTPIVLLDVDFASPRTVWASGYYNGYYISKGCLFKSSDGGQRWSLRLKTPINSPPLTVDFADATHGFFGGGFDMGRTVNGGQSWVLQHWNAGYIFGMSFVDAQRGWASGVDGSLWWTTDGAQSWNVLPQTGPIRLSVRMWGVSMVDAEAAFGVGEAGAFVSAIGPPSSPSTYVSLIQNAPDLHGVHFVDRQTGWAVGASGAILKTLDGGRTWTPQASGTSQVLRGIDAF